VNLPVLFIGVLVHIKFIFDPLSIGVTCLIRAGNFFKKMNAVGKALHGFYFWNSKNPNLRPWTLEPKWLGCIFTFLTK
jgi:hypothetical protein